MIRAALATGLWIVMGLPAEAEAGEPDSAAATIDAGWTELAPAGRYADALASRYTPEGLPAEYAEAYLRNGEVQLLNFTGRYLEAHSRSASAAYMSETPIDFTDPDAVIDLETVNTAVPEAAINAIRELARDRQIVILNEAHQMGRHRAFAIELVRALREDGFTYFGAEAFSPTAEAAWQARAVPRRETGFYFSDPLFGELLRTVDTAGYHWFDYEARADQEQDCSPDPCSAAERVASRERAQAGNIVEAVLAEHPDARLVLYVGYSHLDETPGLDEAGRPLGWMAAELTRLTGIDPLTIDQVSGSGMGNAQIGTLARALRDRHTLTEPSVFRREDGSLMPPPASRWLADLMVVFPRYTPVQGRAPWLFDRLHRLPVPIELDADPARPMVVQAFRAPHEAGDRPFDQLAILPDETDFPVTLALDDGSYDLVLQIAGDPDLEFGHVDVSDGEAQVSYAQPPR